MDDLVQQANDALQAGDRARARAMLVEAVQLHPDNAAVWRCLADAVDSAIERRVCLEHLRHLEADDADIVAELDRMGPPPPPEPSPSQLVSAVKTNSVAHFKRRIGQVYWRWLHAS